LGQDDVGGVVGALPAKPQCDVDDLAAGVELVEREQRSGRCSPRFRNIGRREVTSTDCPRERAHYLVAQTRRRVKRLVRIS
jgi:hypothetical protein